MALRNKQRKFVTEYLVDLNATQAAIRAGYSKKTAASQGHEYLRKPEIAAAITEEQKKRSDRTMISSDRVLLEIARLAFSDPRKIFDESGALRKIQDWPDEVAAAISSIKVFESRALDGTVVGETKEVKFWDKGKQLELAGRHVGLFERDNNQKKEAIAALAASAAISAADAYRMMIGK